MEDTALALPLEGEWARRPADGGDLGALGEALAPLGAKLAVLLWPRKPPAEANRYLPGILHLDAGQDLIESAAPEADAGRSGLVYRRLPGPGRHDPAALGVLAEHLVARAGRGGESFVIFSEAGGGLAALDAMVLQEAVEQAGQDQRR